jgi:agmatinase
VKTLGPAKNFLAIEREASSLDTAAVAIVSAPYEHSVSYGGGTAKGPAAIMKASAYVEFYDDEFNRELCYDVGIATLKPLNVGKYADQAFLDILQQQVAELLDAGKFVVTLGGEHTITAAPVRAYAERVPNLSVLQFDAHSDLRHEYQGSIYSHASVMARVAETVPPSRITQVGIRAQCKEEAEYIRAHKVNTFYASAIRRGVHGDVWWDKVAATLTNDVYITIDVDALDPSIMPATGTPEPEGLTYTEILDVVRAVRRSGRRIVGFDVVELAPMKGLHHPDLTTARLLYKVLNIAFSEAPRKRAKATSMASSAGRRKA